MGYCKLIFKEKRDGSLVSYMDLTKGELFNYNSLLRLMKSDLKEQNITSWTITKLILRTYRKNRTPTNKIALTTLRRMVFCLLLRDIVVIRQICRGRIIYLTKKTRKRWEVDEK